MTFKKSDSLIETLQKYTFNSNQCVYNPSYESLRNETVKKHNHPLLDGTVLKSNALSIRTGRFTGRSPKDKYVVEWPENKNIIWWQSQGSDNHPMKPKTFESLRDDYVLPTLRTKKIYVLDGFCGAKKNSRLAIRLITEIPWQAIFFQNMFIPPTEVEQFEPFWTILSSPTTICPEYEQFGLNSEIFVAFDFKKQVSLLAGTWYTGEIKKGAFTVMNYFLPNEGIGSFHCSANKGKNGDVALFFGLSGTGKTTLSNDPNRELIGDDEHGWDSEGIFNFEGGCYAKLIDLSEKKEPNIYHAIHDRALVENVKITDDNWIDFANSEITQNIRVSYPLSYIPYAIIPSYGDSPKNVIFLTCDAYGVIPPISILNNEQAFYYLLAGYTAKIAGTEIGVTEPEPTFSTCFAKPFLAHKPEVYASLFKEKVIKHNVNVYFLNTGWTGGKYGVGHRISIKDTRTILDAVFSGELQTNPTTVDSYFGLKIPKKLTNVDSTIFNPINTWSDKVLFNKVVKQLIESFEKKQGPIPKIHT